MLREVYDVAPQRRELCLDAAESTMAALARQQEGDISLYVGIPFCPTRCAYCSFVSHTVERAGKLVEPYVERLAEVFDKMPVDHDRSDQKASNLDGWNFYGKQHA